MKKKIKLILFVFAISFLISCAGQTTVLPKSIPGTVKIYTVNDQGTVEIIDQNMNVEPKHWLYISCNHWSGCYMRCQGKLKSCKKVARDSNFEVDYTYTP